MLENKQINNCKVAGLIHTRVTCLRDVYYVLNGLGLFLKLSQRYCIFTCNVMTEVTVWTFSAT